MTHVVCWVCKRTLTCGKAGPDNPRGYIGPNAEGHCFCPIRDWKTCIRPEEEKEEAA